MNKAQQFLQEITEISPRRKEQLAEQLADFKAKLKTASGSDKKTLEMAIEGTQLALEGKPVSDSLTKAIFKALELL